jgi:hypothetical protein
MNVPVQTPLPVVTNLLTAGKSVSGISVPFIRAWAQRIKAEQKIA